jgi:hypothetical protein
VQNSSVTWRFSESGHAGRVQLQRVHAVLAPERTLFGGHVMTMAVRASLEVSLTAFDVPVTRAFNSAFNLCTIELPLMRGARRSDPP